MGKFQTPADRILAVLIGCAIGLMLMVLGDRIWNHHLNQKDEVRQAVEGAVGKMQNDVLFVVQKQKYDLEKRKIDPHKRVAIPTKATKEMKSALTELNKSIAAHNELAVDYREQYLRMLKDLELAVMKEDRP